METKRARETKTYSDKRNYGQKKNKESTSFVNKPKTAAYVPPNAVVLDNGAYSIKIGYATDKQPLIYPNCIMKAKSEKKRFFIGDQIEDCRDLSGLYYLNASEKGYICKYDIQKTIWDYTFNKYPITDETVLITQPLFNFKNNQEFTDEVFYEEYECKAMFRANATDFANHYTNKFVNGASAPCLVIDSGHSFTHIVPYISGEKYASAIIRLDIGGKLLTNYLKDIISYRQLHVMEETYVINQVKEDVCYVALDFKAEMQRSKKSHDIVQSYVLPDFHNVRRGYIQQPGDERELPENCQILRLNNERIMVPELFMKPSIVPGFEEAGLAQLIAASIAKCPQRVRSRLSENIVLIGGNFAFPGFKERLEAETRMFLPCEYKLNIHKPVEPLLYAWNGAAKLSEDPSFPEMCVTRKQYEESGSSLTYEKFNSSYEKRPRKTKKKEAIAPQMPEPPLTEVPTYVEHFEGIDLFKKMPESAKENKAEVEFILEGDDIEQYDNQFVTVEITNNLHSPRASIRLTGDVEDDESSNEKCIKRRLMKTDAIEISEEMKEDVLGSSEDSEDDFEQSVICDESGLIINPIKTYGAAAAFKKDEVQKLAQNKPKKRSARRNSKTIQIKPNRFELRRGGINKRKTEQKLKTGSELMKLGLKTIPATLTPPNNLAPKPKLDYKNLKPEDVPLLQPLTQSKAIPRITKLVVPNRGPDQAINPTTTLFVRPINPSAPRIQQHIIMRPIGGTQIVPIRGETRILMPQPVRTLLQNQPLKLGVQNQPTIRFVMQNQTVRINTQNQIRPVIQTNRIIQTQTTVRPIMQNQIRPVMQMQPIKTFVNQPIRTIIQNRAIIRQPIRKIVQPIRNYNNRQPICTVLQNSGVRTFAQQPVRYAVQGKQTLRQQTIHNFLPQTTTTTAQTDVFTINTSSTTATTRTISLNQANGLNVPQNILNNSMVQFLPFNQDLMKKGNSYIIAKKNQPVVTTQTNPPPLQSFPSTSFQIQHNEPQQQQPIQLSIQANHQQTHISQAQPPVQYTVQPLLVPQQISLDQIPVSIQNNPVNTDWSAQ